MEELKMTTDVLGPETIKTIEFSVTHPSKLLSMMPGLLQDMFKIGGSSVFEDVIKWDVTDPEKRYFFGEWRAKVKKDERSTAWFSVKIQGEQNVKDQFGKAAIKVTAYLTSSWKFSSVIDKALGYYYVNNVYANRRRGYIEEVKRNIEDFEGFIRKKFEIVGR